MNIDELLASYDPIDQDYEESIYDPCERRQSIDDRVEYAAKGRESRPGYMSFVPNKEEVERILLDPLRRWGTGR